jgi:galactonate dehydratase
MKITAVETIYISRGVTVHQGPIQWLWVRIHTDTGLVGLGETYPWPEAEAAVVKRALAPVLLGRDPLQIDRLWTDMFQRVNFSGWAGAEIRAISAVDMALWDLAGKAAGVPVYQLLGGASRDSIRTYNTCYDHISFHKEPVRLADSLLKSGIRAMKIWPFDPIALDNRGQFITREQMRQGIEPLRLIKQEFGEDMEVAMEFHGYWNLHCAIQIAQECEQYSPMWLEEMLPQDNLAAYSELAAATNLPLCVSERLMTRWGFRELMENGAARIIMPDIAWCGGISEARKIASAAETLFRPIAPHNCGGPVLHAASLHLASNITNLYILESVRRHYADEYRGLVTNTFEAQDGTFSIPSGPGLGVELTEETLARPDATIVRIDE